MKKTGILLTNLGTPDAPTAPAVRRYLNQFLSDRRVVELNRYLWFIILHGLILRIRPRRSAENYQRIWQADSPLRSTSQAQTQALQALYPNIKLALGMRYGTRVFPKL